MSGLGMAHWETARGAATSGIGYEAGTWLAGSNNVAIASFGTSSDNGVIRIGTPATQTVTYIAGISTSQVTGSAVYVTSSGSNSVFWPPLER